MNPFDLAIIHFVNQFAQLSEAFDYFVIFVANNNLIKGGVLVLLLWWGWFKPASDQQQVRANLISTLIGCFIAMIIARAMALLLPFRFRPMHESDLTITLPYGVKPTVLEGWSSFPSDHAVLFYALSVGMFYISRKVGILALVYTSVFIGLPRIYLGLHYPTDILVGALVGMIVILMCQRPFFVQKISQPVLHFSNSKPEIFYPVLFLITYQIVDLFENSRSLLSYFASLFKSFFG